MTTLLVALIGLAAMFTPVQAVLQESKVPESAVPVYGRLMPAQAVNVDHNFRIRQNKGIRSFGSGVVPRLLSPTGRNAASDDGHAVSVMGALLDQNSPGVYSYSFKDNTFTPVALSDDLFANGNAILAGDTYYCFYVDGSEGRYFVYINKFKTRLWPAIHMRLLLRQVTRPGRQPCRMPLLQVLTAAYPGVMTFLQKLLSRYIRL